MNRVVHGIRMMKGIMLTSTRHLLAQWHTTPYYRVPLPVFLSTAPDWSVLDKVALDNAIKGLPVPVVGPAPPGISVHDAIKVKLHDSLFTMSYTISHTMSYVISHTMSYTTLYDIVYVYDIVYDIGI
jgi:hypothetical protein